MARSLSTRARFAVAYLVLGAAVGTGLGLLIVLVQRPTPLPPPPWSAWQPQASVPASRLLEIADHVGREYRLPSGDQLVAIKVGGASQGTAKFNGIVVVKKDNPRSLDRQYNADDTAVYILCGMTPNTCAINEGSPSVARGTVLRREALELALYTFRYNKPIDNILIFFPPLPGEKTLSRTLFFSRDDLSGSLDHPLRETLPQARAPEPGEIKAKEKDTVDDLTGSKLYKYLGISQNVIVIQPAA
jgi:hypothetical protein